jgi:hypothetical protein
MQLIDKDALVAEIEKLQKRYGEFKTRNIYEEGLKEGRLIGYKDALYKLDTIEVKEIDLEKEIREYFVSHPDEFFSDKYKLIAKHFFELVAPSIPSDIDEVAEEYANSHYGEFLEIGYEFGEPIETTVDDKPFVRDAFKAGAEWILSQIKLACTIQQ